MADTQEAPQPAIQPLPALGGSVTEAQEAILGLMEPEEEKPKEEEAKPTEEEESTEETQDESLEEESEEEAETEEEEEESEESDDEVEEEPDVYAVTVNGQEQEVTFDELLKGYSRQSDYTRKTQELSDNRREFESMQQAMAQEYQQIQAERQQYVEALQNVIDGSVMGLDQLANVDWNKLKEEDPVAFITKKEEFRESQDRLRDYQTQQQEVMNQQYAENRESMKQSLVQEHQKMASIVPDWGIPEKQKELASSLKEYAISNGYTAEEVSSLADHRSLIMLLKAQKYDSLQKADVKSKKLKNKPKVIRAGKGKDKSDTDKSKRAAQMKRLRGTGHIDDASALLEDFIDI
jgi:hypothetical protein